WNVIQSSRVTLTIPSSLLPEMLREPVNRWYERAGAQVGLIEVCESLPEPCREELLRVVAASEFAASVLIRDPEALAWAMGAMTVPLAAAVNADYERRVAGCGTVAEVQRVLREWRRREMLRIAWRDIAGHASVQDTLGDLSRLADACIRASVAAARTQLRPPFGLPRTAQGAEVPLIVLGMGKLGGGELNFSSDVDLILLFPEHGETDGVRPIANEEFFTRLGQSLVRLLESPTAEGFVLRVDL